MAPKIPTDLDFISDYGSREILAKSLRTHCREKITAGERDKFFGLWFCFLFSAFYSFNKAIVALLWLIQTATTRQSSRVR